MHNKCGKSSGIDKCPQGNRVQYKGLSFDRHNYDGGETQPCKALTSVGSPIQV